MVDKRSPSFGLTAEYIRSVLLYDPETGALSWKAKLGTDSQTVAWNIRFAGRRAGCLHWKGYRQLQLLGKKWPAALVAWIHTGGEMPLYCIDHKNGIRDDDRLSNLRPATAAQNSANKRCLAVSGLKGAHLDRARGYFTAEITVQGKRRKLGAHATAEAAHAAYRAAATQLQGAFARLE